MNFPHSQCLNIMQISNLRKFPAGITRNQCHRTNILNAIEFFDPEKVSLNLKNLTNLSKYGQTRYAIHSLAMIPMKCTATNCRLYFFSSNFRLIFLFLCFRLLLEYRTYVNARATGVPWCHIFPMRRAMILITQLPLPGDQRN